MNVVSHSFGEGRKGEAAGELNFLYEKPASTYPMETRTTNHKGFVRSKTNAFEKPVFRTRAI
jgi:hypothetical protein